ncbi:TIGR00180 family glycosyltransferase [Fusibacter sp. 3D3]|uniref:TIGR00180 family glycosyltransferase n=1 Tax=Fusibacter sp. 3D3 TaxID=1048380 RepID=UPI000853C61F|nr:TIGR00180 family glycosyltransferase [Fusibacter sp. 3D3]GAU75662.1 glutamine-hydrolyzing asparagine synthetase [Fusibacter sp. 3D3]
MDNNRMISVLKQKIRISIELGEHDRACKLSEKYAYKAIEDTDFGYYLGEINLFQKNFERALFYIAYGLSKMPYDYAFLMLLGDVLKEKEDLIEALAAYRKAFNSNFRTQCVDSAKNSIQMLKSCMKKEENEEYWMAYIDRILVIDFGYTNDLYLWAKELEKYNLCVDLATNSGKYRNEIFNSTGVGKLIMIQSIDEIMEYADYYQYDLIYVLNAEEQHKKFLNLKYPKVIIDETIEFEKLKIRALEINKKNRKLNVFNKVYNNFTIVAVTLNRPQNFKKVIQSIIQFKSLNPKIIVLDSSSDENAKKNQFSLKNLEMTHDLKYYHLPIDTTYAEKILIAMDKIDTEFFCFSPDDDYYTEEGLYLSLEFLNKNLDYYSVKGKNFAFKEEYGFMLEYDKFNSILSPKAFDRTNSYLDDFPATIMYQVFRTSEYQRLIKYYELNEAFMCKNHVFLEYLIYLMNVATGKIGKINVDLNIRNKGVTREFAVETLKDTVVNGKFNDNYIAFKNSLVGYCDYINNPITDNEAETLFMKFMTRFICVPMQYLVKEQGGYNIEKLLKGFEYSWTK